MSESPTELPNKETGTSEPTGGPTLTQRTAHGFVWMIIQTLGSKVVSTISQIALAWLLTEGDFGLWALVGTATAFAGLPMQLGLNKILVQRQAHFRLWQNPAFWMSLASGIVAGLAICVSSPFAAFAYHSKHLIPLLLIFALTPPLDSLAVVPTAYQTMHLRFRLLAGVGLGYNVTNILLTVLFAACGLGAYSFVLPRPIVALAQAVYLWSISPIKLKWTPQLQRWRYLVGDVGWQLGGFFFWLVIMQGDYMSLGLFHTEIIVGVYFFAFNLSSQSAQLLQINFANVIFPILSRLQNEPGRQLAAFYKSLQMLALVAFPASGLQALLAVPIIRLLFGHKWDSAIGVFQILSIGMGFSMVLGLCCTYLQAQGNFKKYFYWSGILALFFLCFVLLASYQGQAVLVSVAVLTFYVLVGPFGVFVATRGVGNTAGGSGGEVTLMRIALNIYVIPFITSLVSLVPAYLMYYNWSEQFPEWIHSGCIRLNVPMLSVLWYERLAALLEITILSLVCLVIYVVILRLIFPGKWKIIHEQMDSLLFSKLSGRRVMPKFIGRFF